MRAKGQDGSRLSSQLAADCIRNHGETSAMPFWADHKSRGTTTRGLRGERRVLVEQQDPRASGQTSLRHQARARIPWLISVTLELRVQM